MDFISLVKNLSGGCIDMIDPKPNWASAGNDNFPNVIVFFIVGSDEFFSLGIGEHSPASKAGLKIAPGDILSRFLGEGFLIGYLELGHITVLDHGYLVSLIRVHQDKYSDDWNSVIGLLKPDMIPDICLIHPRDPEIGEVRLQTEYGV